MDEICCVLPAGCDQAGKSGIVGRLLLPLIEDRQTESQQGYN